MLKNRIDAFFHMASYGDKEAYSQLYKEFVKRANTIINSTIKTYSQFKGIAHDFCDVIDDLFFKAINEFGPEKGSFSSFVDYLLSRRLLPLVKKEVSDIQTYIADIDFDDEEVKTIDLLPDPNQSKMADEIAVKNFKQTIASPNSHKTQAQRTRDKVLLLQYAGYKNTEICKILNITYAQLRRISDKAKKDEDISNIKLDLK